MPPFHFLYFSVDSDRSVPLTRPLGREKRSPKRGGCDGQGEGESGSSRQGGTFGVDSLGHIRRLQSLRRGQGVLGI